MIQDLLKLFKRNTSKNNVKDAMTEWEAARRGALKVTRHFERGGGN